MISAGFPLAGKYSYRDMRNSIARRIPCLPAT
jgi:hypothetical protein